MFVKANLFPFKPGEVEITKHEILVISLGILTLMFELSFVEYFFQNGASIPVSDADIEIISRGAGPRPSGWVYALCFGGPGFRRF